MRTIPVEYVADEDAWQQDADPIEVRVSYGTAQRGSAETVALIDDGAGGVVENRCAVSEVGSRNQVVTSTTAAGDEGSLFLSVEWAGDAAAEAKEEQQ
jgi:hypothetical protein